MTRILLALAGATLLFAAPRPSHAAPIRVLIIDGDADRAHNWKLDSAVMKAELDEAGLFQTEVVTAPAFVGGDFSNFKPDFSKYQVVVMNYQADDWPESLKTPFEAFVRNGGGLVVVHCADCSFPLWKAYNEMVGMAGFRNRTEKDGAMWYVKDGKLVADNAPGPRGRHGLRIPYLIKSQNSDHPIMKDLPKAWMHQGDEMYNTLAGPGAGITLLASAWSDPENRGTGRDEPQVWVSSYGKGRVFVNVAGHDTNAKSSVDFITLLQRGTEWVATGKVTQKVPADFPSAQSVSYRANIAALDPNYKNGLNALTARPGAAPGAPGGRGGNPAAPAPGPQSLQR
jgi:type 1 glutamine amidotransferase